MSVVFLDAPGKTLDGKAEALDFTVSGEAVAISVGFGSLRNEERAYRDGAFLRGYTGSTKSGTTYRLVREGGWPAAPQLYVDEAAASTAGQAMGAIYEVDLRAQGSLTMTSAGSYTIDGKTWWAKGALSSGVCNLVSGSGLRLQKSSAQVNGGWRAQNADFADRLLAFDFGQLADFNPVAPLAVEWRFTSPSALSGSQDRWAVAGVSDFVKSSASYTAAEKAKAVCLNVFGATSAYFDGDPTVNDPIDLGQPSVGTVAANIAQGLYRFSLRRFFPLLGTFSTSLGGPDDYQSYDLTVTKAWTGNGMSNTPGFIFLLEKPFGGVALDIYLTHLKILQPRSP